MKPQMVWRKSEHTRAFMIEKNGRKYVVKSEGPNSERFRLFIDGHRTEVHGSSGPNYVMVRAENIMNGGGDAALGTVPKS